MSFVHKNCNPNMICGKLRILLFLLKIFKVIEPLIKNDALLGCMYIWGIQYRGRWGKILDEIFYERPPIGYSFDIFHVSHFSYFIAAWHITTWSDDLLLLNDDCERGMFKRRVLKVWCFACFENSPAQKDLRSAEKLRNFLGEIFYWGRCNVNP